MTEKQFRKQSRLQIALPFGIGVLLIAAVIVSATLTSFGSFSGWADASLILLIIPTMVMGILLLAILAGLAYLVFRLIGAIPGPAARLRELSERLAHRSKTGGESVARVVMIPRSATAAVRAGWQAFFSIFRKNEG